MSQSDTRPIGLLDSGVGGLSVLREVRRQLPAESLIYFADEAHLPYGPRSREQIRGFVAGITDFLRRLNCKLIIIACNAANAAALHTLRAAHSMLPIIGMEPAIKPAAEATKTGVIGVITTRATYQGELFASVIDRFAQGVHVETQVCPDLVLLVEAGAPDTPDARAALEGYLRPLQAAGIDQLVLGCTHFPFLSGQIRAVLGEQVGIIDPAPAVARQAARILHERGLAADPSSTADVTFYTSADPEHLRMLIRQLLGDQSADVRAARWRGEHLIWR